MYLEEHDNPEEYDIYDLKDQYCILDWIACQLVFQRPIKTKQYFIYGEPSTQKTLMLHYIAKALRVYMASSRINDFSGADDFFDL